MPALVINAPTLQAALRGARDFDTVLKLRVGEAYCFTSSEAQEIRPGWNVIVLDKTKRRRADGKLVRLEPVAHGGPCSSGKAPYDVYLDDHLEEVDFDAPLPPLSLTPKRIRDGSLRLNRSGIAILR